MCILILHIHIGNVIYARGIPPQGHDRLVPHDSTVGITMTAPRCPCRSRQVATPSGRGSKIERERSQYQLLRPQIGDYRHRIAPDPVGHLGNLRSVAFDAALRPAHPNFPCSSWHRLLGVIGDPAAAGREATAPPLARSADCSSCALIRYWCREVRCRRTASCETPAARRAVRSSLRSGGGCPHAFGPRLLYLLPRRAAV